MVEAVAPLRNGGGIAGVSCGTWDEASMQQSLVFSDTIQDLKTLRSQLYSAAEYFELAYTTGDEKQTVVSNLKEYAVNALVNTVDHLGSISFNVASLVDQRFDEVADADHRVSCIQQRTQTSQACMDREGLSQQSLVITAPKYHKRYILPAGGGDSMPNAVPNFREMSRIKNKAGEMQQVHTARPKAREKQPSFSKLRSMARAPSQRARSSSPAQHLRPPAPTETVISIIGDINKSDSPVSSTNPLARSGSLSRKASLLKTSSVRVQSSSEPKKLASLRLHAERNDETQEGEQTPKKGRKFLKSLLSRRKSRKDEPLSGYLDEY